MKHPFQVKVCGRSPEAWKCDELMIKISLKKPLKCCIFEIKVVNLCQFLNMKGHTLINPSENLLYETNQLKR